MDMYLAIQILLSGLVSGFVLFQTAFVAPTVFTKVVPEARPSFLRSIFPKLFKATAVLGALFLLASYLGPSTSWVHYVVGIYTTLAGIVCNILVPATNKAKDEGNEQKFAILHKVSVITTVLALILNLVWIFV